MSMMATFGLERLSPAERLQLVDEILDSLPDQIGPDEVPPWHIEEIEKRLGNMETGAASAKPWREALARLKDQP